MDNFASVAITEKEAVGKCLTAKQGFHPGDVILIDDYALVGPAHKTEPVCLNCLKLIDGSSSPCHQCESPMCQDCQADQNRSDQGFHTSTECQILSSTFHQISSFPYHAILPLRLAVEASNRTQVWENLGQLMDHEAERQQNKDEWNMFEREVVQFLLPGFQAAGIPMNSELLHRCIGIICVNCISFDLQANKNRRKGRALYPLMTLASHSCDNNTAFTLHSETLRLTLKARKTIRPSDEITISYIPMIVGQPLRGLHIRKEWSFDCTCSRCQDPTDHGSFISAIKCKHCKARGVDGCLLPLPASKSSSWSCNICNDTEDVFELVSSFEKQLREVCDKGNSGLKSLSDLERFVTKMNEVLHQNHFLILIAKRNIVSIITKLLSKIPNDVKLMLLAKKLKLCEELLFAVKKLDDGYSEWLGFIYQELAMSLSLMRKMKGSISDGYTGAIAFYLKESQACGNIFNP